MIDLKDRPDFGWNLLLGLSVVGIAVSIWFGFISPVPQLSWISKTRTSTLNPTVERANAKIADDLAQIRRQSWKVSSETLGSAVLAYLSGVSEKNSVQLTGFRTEKTVDVAKLTEAPFVVVVEGGFPDVVAFARKLEDPSSKLAVNLMQISASDTGPGRVTATFGLLGFLVKEPQ